MVEARDGFVVLFAYFALYGLAVTGGLARVVLRWRR